MRGALTTLRQEDTLCTTHTGKPLRSAGRPMLARIIEAALVAAILWSLFAGYTARRTEE
jgi:hypothetical protein